MATLACLFVWPPPSPAPLQIPIWLLGLGIGHHWAGRAVWPVGWNLACWCLADDPCLWPLVAQAIYSLWSRSWLEWVCLLLLLVPAKLAHHQGIPPLLTWWLIGSLVLLAQRHLQAHNSRLELQAQPLRWAAWWLGLAGLWLPLGWTKAMLLPGLWALGWAHQNVLFRLQAEAAQAALEESQRSQILLREILSERDQLRGNEQILQQLEGVSDWASLGQVLGSHLGPALKLRSLAILSLEQCHWVHSPEAEKLSNLTLWAEPDWQQPQPQFISPAWLESEPQALWLPQGEFWLYLGRQDAWTRQDFARLAEVLTSLGPLRQRWAVRAQLTSLQFLLNCAERLLRPLEVEELWQTFYQCLISSTPLQFALWLPSDCALSLQAGASPPAHFCEQDPQPWPGLGQWLCFHQPEGRLYLALAGRPLHPEEAGVLEALTRLLALAMGRAQLYVRIQRSQERWLESQRSLSLAQLSAGLAHELNSPLAAISLAIQSSLRDQPNVRLEKAQAACERAQQIIERLAELSQQERNRSSDCQVPLVVAALAEQLPDWAARTQLSGPPQMLMPLPEADLQRALLALWSNASEAGQQLSIEWGQREGEVFCCVRDDGPGIPSSDQARLGQAFFTTKAVGKHLGLGLATVAQICRVYRGRWTLQTRPQYPGSEFGLWFPLA